MLAGLINLHGQHVRFADIVPTYKFEDWGQSLPKLLIFSREKIVYRNTGIFCSTTQLMTPPRIFWLQKQLEWYESPMDQQATYLGTKTHLLFEQSAAKLTEMGWLTEVPYIVPITLPNGEIVWIGLMFDSVDQNTETLFDYKVSKKYKALKGKDPAEWLNWPGGACSDWMIQLSVYRWGLQHPGKRKILNEGTDQMTLVNDPTPIPIRRAILDLTVKDYDKHRPQGLKPIETYSVPLMSPADTEAWVTARVAYLSSFSSATRSEELPDCTPGEIWAGKDGRPKRCPDFCPISKLESCHQFIRDFPGMALSSSTSQCSPSSVFELFED